MTDDRIVEIGIRADGGLFVRPENSNFANIYRAGMEVSWDGENGRLFAPRPRDWTYARWFQQIVAAAAGEYHIALHLTETTTWTGVPDSIRDEINALA